MTTDYLVSSLPALAFRAPAPLSWERFRELAGEGACALPPAKRDELLDKVWWDAAGELASPSSPLGRGALAAYAVRLRIAIRRDGISREKGNEAFDRLTAETKR